jgi:hypothetical protein
MVEIIANGAARRPGVTLENEAQNTKTLDARAAAIAPERWKALRMRLEHAAQQADEAAHGSSGRWLTVADAARRLGVGRDIIELLIDDNPCGEGHARARPPGTSRISRTPAFVSSGPEAAQRIRP